MRSPVAELLATLGAAIEQAGGRWYLFGAQAALLYGAARLTADVDVTVDLCGHPSSRLVSALQDAGLEVRVEEIERFVERTRVIPLLDPRSGMAVDVVLAGPGLELMFFERVRQRTVEGVPVPVASQEDVIAMKMLAGRPKDLDDVVAILAAHPSQLDLSLIRNTLGMMETALGQSDLLPAFEGALDRAKR